MLPNIRLIRYRPRKFEPRFRWEPDPGNPSFALLWNEDEFFGYTGGFPNNYSKRLNGRKYYETPDIYPEHRPAALRRLFAQGSGGRPQPERFAGQGEGGPDSGGGEVGQADAVDKLGGDDLSTHPGRGVHDGLTVRPGRRDAARGATDPSVLYVDHQDYADAVDQGARHGPFRAFSWTEYAHDLRPLVLRKQIRGSREEAI